MAFIQQHTLNNHDEAFADQPLINFANDDVLDDDGGGERGYGPDSHSAG